MYLLGNVSDFLCSKNFTESTIALQNTRHLKRKHCKSCWALELCTTCPAQLLLYESKTQQSYCDNIRNELSKKLVMISKKTKEGSLFEHLII